MCAVTVFCFSLCVKGKGEKSRRRISYVVASKGKSNGPYVHESIMLVNQVRRQLNHSLMLTARCR
jgi:hypothetical protein